MKPRLLAKEALLIAGVAGVGNKTREAWEAFMNLSAMSPLQNKAGEEAYEVRIYPAEGPGEVHVGVCVKDSGVPAEYKIIIMPASLYAEFEIYPSKGYGSSNADIEEWLSENASFFKQGRLGDRVYAIEVYDHRFKGEQDPESVVGMLIPICKAGL